MKTTRAVIIQTCLKKRKCEGKGCQGEGCPVRAEKFLREVVSSWEKGGR